MARTTPSTLRHVIDRAVPLLTPEFFPGHKADIEAGGLAAFAPTVASLGQKCDTHASTLFAGERTLLSALGCPRGSRCTRTPRFRRELSGAVRRRRRRLVELLERLLVTGAIGESRQIVSDGDPAGLTRIAPAGRRVAIVHQGAAHSLEPVEPDLQVPDAAVGVEVDCRACTCRRGWRRLLGCTPAIARARPHIVVMTSPLVGRIAEPLSRRIVCGKHRDGGTPVAAVPAIVTRPQSRRSRPERGMSMPYVPRLQR